MTWLKFLENTIYKDPRDISHLIFSQELEESISENIDTVINTSWEDADSLYIENNFRNERYQIGDFVYFYGKWKSLIVKNTKTNEYREFNHELISSSVHIYKNTPDEDNIWCCEFEIGWKSILVFWDKQNYVIIDCDDLNLIEALEYWIHRTDGTFKYIPKLRNPLESMRKWWDYDDYDYIVKNGNFWTKKET